MHILHSGYQPKKDNDTKLFPPSGGTNVGSHAKLLMETKEKMKNVKGGKI